MMYELLEKLFAEHKFDYVYHLAAYAAEGFRTLSAGLITITTL
jgi:nucleoside-diphosphate-sugar epimerase